MLAVGCVIKNRAASENKTIYEICTAANQFSSLTVHSDPETTLWPPLDDNSWQVAQTIATKIITGNYNDITNGANYYYDPRTATSGWFVDNIVNNPQSHPLTVIIGNHHFFK